MLARLHSLIYSTLREEAKTIISSFNTPNLSLTELKSKTMRLVDIGDSIAELDVEDAYKRMHLRLLENSLSSTSQDLQFVRQIFACLITDFRASLPEIFGEEESKMIADDEQDAQKQLAADPDKKAARPG